MTSDAGCGPGCTCGAPGREQFVTLGMPSREAVRTSSTGRHDLEQAVIPAGTFTMGDSSGGPGGGDDDERCDEEEKPVQLPA